MDNGGHSLMDEPAGAERPVNNLDSVSTGRRLLMGVDGRTAWARRFRYLTEAHIADLGGPDHVSEAERSIVRRASALEVECERLEASFATAEWDRPSGRPGTEHLDLYNRLSGNLRRLLEALGLQRRARDVGPGRDGELAPFLDHDDDAPAPSAHRRREKAREGARRAARQRTR